MLLTPDLLERLADKLHEQGLPALDRLRPGLTDGEMDTLTTPIGIDLPAEARVWWGWHDGVSASEIKLAREREIGAGFQYLPLSEAVVDYGALQARAVDLSRGPLPPADNPEWHWQSNWFPISELGKITVDCSVPKNAPTPIRCVDWHFDDFREIRTKSFGEMIIWWIDALDSGAWAYNFRVGRWDCPEGILDPIREQSGLV